MLDWFKSRPLKAGDFEKITAVADGTAGGGWLTQVRDHAEYMGVRVRVIDLISGGDWGRDSHRVRVLVRALRNNGFVASETVGSQGAWTDVLVSSRRYSRL